MMEPHSAHMGASAETAGNKPPCADHINLGLRVFTYYWHTVYGYGFYMALNVVLRSRDYA
jgi:hypothetical protein